MSNTIYLYKASGVNATLEVINALDVEYDNSGIVFEIALVDETTTATVFQRMVHATSATVLFYDLIDDSVDGWSDEFAEPMRAEMPSGAMAITRYSGQEDRIAFRIDNLTRAFKNDEGAKVVTLSDSIKLTMPLDVAQQMAKEALHYMDRWENENIPTLKR